MKRRLVLLMTCLFCSIGLALAQNKRISGTVVDSNGEPVTGATVVVKGTTIGASTDENGKFTISILPGGKRFVVSLVGSKTKEVPIEDNLKIVLESSDLSLNEVVVTALGIAKEKKSLGYAVQDVKSDELNRTSQLNVANALQGKVSGVQITQAGGAVGASQRILIRGNSSFNSNDPLIVIDGVPMDGGAGSQDGSDGKGLFGHWFGFERY